ncbi:MAG: LuxR C-terminal-related transcriptional regulator [Acidimicrobiales bacterium]
MTTSRTLRRGADAAGAEAFVADPLKTTRPARRTGQVDRTDLIARLAATSDCSLVLVTAPTGYGKSTSLAQWAESDPRPVSWVSIDDLDNDPVCFLRHLVLALDRHEPVGDDVAQPLLRAIPPIHTVVLPRLGRALLDHRKPFVVIVDDTHLVRSADTLDCLRAVLDHLPAGSSLVLSGRSTPDLPIGRLRLQHRVAELGPEELAMTLPEAGALMQAAGVELSPQDLRELLGQTEGWPAGLALAAMAVTDGNEPHRSLAGFGGEHRLVAEYLRDELLAGLPEDTSRFLIRSSVLPRLSGALCDGVLETTGSGRLLEALARSKNLFVIPLDDTGGWYRFHHLFGDLLRAELHAQDPADERHLHERASRLAEEQGDLDGAIRHAVAGQATDRAADLVLRHALLMSGRGRNATIGLWLELFDDRQTHALPQVALANGVHQLGLGEAREVERWTDVAEQALRTGSPDRSDRAQVEVAVAALRALTCEPGIAHMTGFTDVVRAAGPDGNEWWGVATLLEGVARALMGDLDAGLASLRESERTTTELPHVHAVGLAQQAYIQIRLDRWDEAARLIARAQQVVHHNALDGYVPIMVVVAVGALIEARAGDTGAARRDAQRARRLVSSGHPTVVRTSLQVYSLLARVELLLGDRVAARTMLDEAQLVAPLEPDARLPHEDLRAVEDALAELDPMGTEPRQLGPSSLTAAELRVLEYLPTHLSLKEIGEKLYVSRNTVKSQAIATYRKLGVSSRGEAVAAARSIGLIEP